MNCMKKGKYKWVIRNIHGNYWNGQTFIMSQQNAKIYLTHGKALLALEKIRAAITGKINKRLVKVEVLTIENKLPSFQEWLQEQNN